MALLQLDMLPMEILQTVSHSLDASHRPSVASLSLVNHICRRAAAPAYFRDLIVHISVPQRLAEDVEQWYQILQASDSFRYVRNVVVAGDIHRHARRRWYGTNTDTLASRPGSLEADEPWMPLAKLIAKLSGLRDMHFHCNTTVPSCLLASLRRDNFFTCRLHITKSSLRMRGTASAAVPTPLVLFPEELAMIKSSNLHAISLSTKSSWCQVDCHPDVIFEIVSRACPKLREVELIQTRPTVPQQERIKIPYPGLKFDQILDPWIKPPGSKAKLTSLTLRGRQSQLQRWQQHTDFTVLRTLKMTGFLETDILDYSTHAAHFPALTCLEIQIPAADTSSGASFLSSVPGLQDLSIVGTVSVETMTVIKQKHGETLHSLSLPNWTCSTNDLTSLRGACPRLSSLAAKIPRTQGDANEVAIYTALGTYPKLRTLSLGLDCAIGLNNTSLADAIARTIKNQTAFVNCAIDSKLAASIFDTISAAKPAGSAPLQSLELNVVNAGVIVASLNDADKCRIFGHFARKWTCHLHPRDDWQGGVVVVEQEASRLNRERHERLVAPLLKLGELEEAFRGLWPGMGGDWRNEWKSFMLQG